MSPTNPDVEQADATRRTQAIQMLAHYFQRPHDEVRLLIEHTDDEYGYALRSNGIVQVCAESGSLQFLPTSAVNAVRVYGSVVAVDTRGERNYLRISFDSDTDALRFAGRVQTTLFGFR